jgi:hypothetical protein
LAGSQNSEKKKEGLERRRGEGEGKEGGEGRKRAKLCQIFDFRYSI